VMMDPRAKASGTKGAANVRVKAGDEVVSSQAADFRPPRLGNEGNQNVSSLRSGQIRFTHPNVSPFQPQLLAATSVKLR
jgi:hypothetical protein